MLQLPSSASQPQFSPDSTHLVYRQAGSLWIRDIKKDKAPEKIGLGRVPRWCPTDVLLALLRRSSDGQSHLWLQPVDMQKEALLLSRERMSVIEYAWSPDGQTIAIMGTEEPWKSCMLWLIATSTRAVQQQWELPEYEYPRSLEWSPDGRMLVWDVVITPDDRTNQTVEVRLLDVLQRSPHRIVPVGACQSRTPTWHPKGHTLALVASPHPYGNQALFGLATWSTQGGITRYLTRDPMLVEGAVWAPDGQTLYLSARNAHINKQLYALSAQDGSLRQLTNGLADYHLPVISSDGHWLACTVEAPDKLSDIWLVATDGSSGHSMTDVNAEISHNELQLGVPELIRWKSVDGLELEGLLLYPPDYGPHGKPPNPLPTIVDIHGGPIYGTPPLCLENHPLTLGGLHELAMHGYLCFAVDYRRSGTYGWHDIQQVIDRGDFVGLDAVDILTGVDTLIK